MKSQNKILIQYNDFHLNFSHLKNDIMQMSQKEFADFLGIATGAVGGYENRTRTPNAKALITICEKCNISADYLLGLSDITKPDSALKFVCEYTGLSENAVQVLHNRQTEIISFNKTLKTLNEELKNTPELQQEAKQINLSNIDFLKILPQVISLIIEESATESIKERGENETGYFEINPFSNDSADFHASELIENIFEYISINIPKNRYIRIDKDYHISEIECEFDEEGNPFTYLKYKFSDGEEYAQKRFIYHKEYKPAKDLNNQFLLNNINEELKKLRNQYQSRSGAVGGDSAKGDDKA